MFSAVEWISQACFPLRRSISALILACCLFVIIIVVKISDISRTDDDFHAAKYQSLTHKATNDTCTRPLMTSSTVIDDCQMCFLPGQSRSPTEGRWYNFSASSSTRHLFYVYSAFYDDRPLKPVVRLVAMTTQYDKASPGTQIHCLLLYADGRTVQVSATIPPPSPIGMGLWMHGNYVQEFIYSCRLPPGDDLPVAVSVRVTTVDRRSTPIPSAFRPPKKKIEPRTTPPPHGVDFEIVASDRRCFVPLEVPLKRIPRRHLGLCVQVAFGDLSPVRLVEWFELQRLLGVELIGVYVAPTVSRPALDVFRRYSAADDGLVELRWTNYIGPVTNADGQRFDVFNSNQHLLQGSPVINDCIYRHMHSFDFIGVYDFDEVVLPRSHANLTEMLDAFNGMKEQPVPEYVFTNNYFFLDLPPDSQISTNFTMLRHRKKVAPSPPGYSVKSIIDPRSCVAMHNHYCWAKLDDGFARWQHSVHVEHSVALLQHYKRCHFSLAECRKLMDNVTVDDSILKYREALVSQVERKLYSRSVSK